MLGKIQEQEIEGSIMKKFVVYTSLLMFGMGAMTTITSYAFPRDAQAGYGGGCPITVPDDWRKCALCPHEC